MIDQKTVASPATESRRARDWRESYALRLVITDLVVLVWTVFGVQFAWFGLLPQTLAVDSILGPVRVNYTLVSVLLVVAWMAVLGIYGTRGYRVLGTGSTEYKLVTDATIRLFGLVAIIAFLLQLDVARGYVLVAFPLGLAVLLISRWAWRQWLGVQRRRGLYSSTVLLVGSEISASHIARELARQPEAGYRVVGACVPSSRIAGYLPDTTIPVFGNLQKVSSALAASGADTVVITSADELPPERVRELSWSLEAGRQHLVVAPSLTDIGGPRIHTRPVAGLPLIHVETPRYEGRKRFSKRAFDIAGSGLILLLLSPVLLAIALAVKFTSAGPVFYKQERIGLNGKPFHMLKFRSMVVNADDQLVALLEAQGTGDTPLFKVQNDPRLTRIGAVLRKHSLDEFPQLINVFRGDMSLVGPRPQREGEVALYTESARRRLIVQPGMTGLWQVSGRSALSWDDAIRLDLYYVENWSLSFDLLILWKTVRVAFLGEGAY